MFFAFFFNFFLWFNYLPCTLFSRKKKKKKEKSPPSAQSFNSFVKLSFSPQTYEKQVLKQVCIGENVSLQLSLGRRLNQFFEGNFFDQVVQGRTELGVHT